MEEEKKIQHPLYLIANILNMKTELTIKHELFSAHALRNFLILKLSKFYHSIEVLVDNILELSEPSDEVTQYDKVYVKILGNTYPRKIVKFQRFSNALIDENPNKEEDKRTPLQRFCRIIISKKMSESGKQLCWRFHIDHINYAGKKWVAKYTGLKVKRRY